MNILVLGAGRMGYGAAFDLAHNSPQVTTVTLADFDVEKAAAAAKTIDSAKITSATVDAGNYESVVELMRGHDSAISCVNYWYNEALSKAAIETRTNFCDLGGNNYIVDAQLAMDAEAKAAGINIIPDCGLAPGMVSILAMHGAAKFDELDAIHIRVGGLPQHPEPPLNYQLVFSVEGLINEYVETARVIRDGKITEVESMTELESLSFDGFPPLEAFQTSGGTSTLPDTFLGKIRELDYKTIRYAGHCDKFKTMIDLGLCSSDDLKVNSGQRTLDSSGSPFVVAAASADGMVKVSPRKIFAELLQRHLPADGPDYVLVRLDFVGRRVSSPHVSKGATTNANWPPADAGGSDNCRLRYDIIDKFDETTDLSAMMRTTAFPASIIAQMMASGDVLSRGATPQEKAINHEKFIEELSRRNILITES